MDILSSIVTFGLIKIIYDKTTHIDKPFKYDHKIVINLENLKKLFRKLISYKIEFGINYYDENNVEITKGEDDVTSFIANNYIINIHTHPAILQQELGHKYLVPSPDDYEDSLHNFADKKHHFVIAPGGLWKYKPTDSLIKLFREKVKTFPSGPLPSFTECSSDSPKIHNISSEDTWNYNNEIKHKFNEIEVLNCKLIQPPELKKLCNPIELNEYYNEMKNIGFEVELIPWNKKWIFEYDKNGREDKILKELHNRNKLINTHISSTELKIKINRTAPTCLVS